MNSIDKAINAIRAAGKTKVDQNAESHVEGSSGGAVSANTSPALYSTIDINPEKKTVTTTVGELPISPLMDPSFHDARARYTRPKPTTTQYKLTKFQRKLRRSPFALALATPIRRSPACTTAIPRFFLERFNLQAHPETGETWIVPTGLNSKVPQGERPEPADPADAAWEAALEEAAGEEDLALDKADSALEEGPVLKDDFDLEEEVPVDEDAALKDDLAANEEAAQDGTVPPNKEPPPKNDSALNDSASLPKEPAKRTPTHPSGVPKGVKTGATAYLLSRQALLQEFNNRNSEYFKQEKKLFRMSDHGLARLTPALKDAVWRSDMDAVLLELMRRRVVEGLCYFAGLVERERRLYLAECKRWDDVEEMRHKGCLLYLGPVEGGETASYVPPRLSTMEIKGSKYNNVILVHNLPDILGKEHLARLREGSEMMRQGELFHLGRVATVQLQMMLWRLQGYMKWDQPKETEGEAGLPSSIETAVGITPPASVEAATPPAEEALASSVDTEAIHTPSSSAEAATAPSPSEEAATSPPSNEEATPSTPGEDANPSAPEEAAP